MCPHKAYLRLIYNRYKVLNIALPVSKLRPGPTAVTGSIRLGYCLNFVRLILAMDRYVAF